MADDVVTSNANCNDVAGWHGVHGPEAAVLIDRRLHRQCGVNSCIVLQG